jgi:tetratricopeptide (TPR) repeat protein
MRFFLLFILPILLIAQPAGPAALAQQARQAMTNSQFDEAARLYRLLIAQLPNVGGLRLNLGLALFQSGQHRPAAAEFQAALKLDPALAPAVMMLGLCHAKLGEPLLALPLLERAHQADPANAVVLLELADAHFATGRFASAAKHFGRLTELQPANPTAWRGLGLSLTEHSQALFAKLPPESPEALTLLARARLAANEPKAAFRLLQQALGRNSTFGPAHASLGDLYQQAGHPDWAAAARSKASPGAGAFAGVEAASGAALAAFARLATLGPSPELYETEAEAARARGAHTEAVEAFHKAIALKPSPNLERGLARALFQSRNYTEALPLLRKWKMNYELGESLLETGEPAQAIPCLLPLRTPAAQAALGRAYLAAGQPAKAIAPLRAALSIDADGSLHFQLARALQRSGAAAQAKEMDAISQQIRQSKAASQQAAEAIQITPP